MKYVFNSQIKVGESFAQEVLNSEIKNEPMFFNCDLEFAYLHGGPITKSFINSLPEEWKNSSTVFDSRVHMLMPGWFPCIPGFHHDDVVRSREDGQPNYLSNEYRSKHILGVVNAQICPTSFAIGKASFEEVPLGEKIYKQWHKEVLKHVEEGNLQLIDVEDRKLVEFDCESWHSGVAANQNGWRWFGRLSKDTDRTNHITNEIRRQTQVYMSDLIEGW